jgi:uncharacterized membrane protein
MKNKDLLDKSFTLTLTAKTLFAIGETIVGFFLISSFAGVYLLVHGLIKLVTLALLWKKLYWAYPLSVLVFSGFIGYQLADFSKTGHVGMILVSLFDVFMIVLTLLEYRKVRGNKIMKKLEKLEVAMPVMMVIVNLAMLAAVFVSAQYFL